MARIDTFQRHGGSHTGSAAAEEEEEKLESPHHAASACRAVQFDGSTRIVLKNSMSSFPVDIIDTQQLASLKRALLAHATAPCRR